MILKSLGIECSPVDIAAPGMEKERDFMRENGKKKEGNRNVLPPQIFNDDKYCGVNSMTHSNLNRVDIKQTAELASIMAVQAY